MLDTADTSPKLPSTFVTIVLPPQEVTSAGATLSSFDIAELPPSVGIVGGSSGKPCRRVGVDVGTL
jgi:hypothetical protein